MRKAYDSDITREQFAHISPDLESARKRTSPRRVDLYVLGLPYASCVTPANTGDREGAVLMFSSPHFYLPTLSCILGDGGYTGSAFADPMAHLTGAKVAIAKRSELHRFAVMPKRWIVERSFAWLDKCRRLWKNCERKLENTMNMVRLAFISILLRRL